MGETNKLLLRIADKSILRISAENAINSLADELVVVVGADGNRTKKELQPLRVSVCFNENYWQGLSTSLSAGIKMVNKNADGALLLLADQPNLASETMNRFIKMFAQGQKKIIAGGYGDMRGNPVLFHRCFFQELQTLSGDTGARSILKKHADEVATIEIPPEQTLDLDTPEDFEKMQALLERQR